MKHHAAWRCWSSRTLNTAMLVVRSLFGLLPRVMNQRTNSWVRTMLVMSFQIGRRDCGREVKCDEKTNWHVRWRRLVRTHHRELCAGQRWSPDHKCVTCMQTKCSINYPVFLSTWCILLTCWPSFRTETDCGIYNPCMTGPFPSWDFKIKRDPGKHICTLSSVYFVFICHIIVSVVQNFSCLAREHNDLNFSYLFFVSDIWQSPMELWLVLRPKLAFQIIDA